jgi:hypothetical protein
MARAFQNILQDPMRCWFDALRGSQLPGVTSVQDSGEVEADIYVAHSGN